MDIAIDIDVESDHKAEKILTLAEESEYES